MKKMRVVFMGSPEFAVPSLEILHECFNVVGVVTQPDRPSGRGRKIMPPPVKQTALKLGISTIQPGKLSEDGVEFQLKEWDADIFVVTAFGQILKSKILNLPKWGCINVHASILPRWRGASPIQSAILAGDNQTGITIMQMDAGIDTGPILNQKTIAILENENAHHLSQRLAQLGAETLEITIKKYITGDIKPIPQPEEGVTYAPLIKKESGWLNFEEDAQRLSRQVLAFNPWPGTRFVWNDIAVKVVSSHPSNQNFGRPGKRVVINKKPAVSTGSGTLVLDVVQMPGKGQIPGEDFLRGNRDWEEL